MKKFILNQLEIKRNNIYMLFANTMTEPAGGFGLMAGAGKKMNGRNKETKQKNRIPGIIRISRSARTLPWRNRSGSREMAGKSPVFPAEMAGEPFGYPHDGGKDSG